MSQKKILTVFGTRPELIKMAPVIAYMSKEEKYFHSKVCFTGQHRDMINEILKIFHLEPDYKLNVMNDKNDLAKLTSLLITELNTILKSFKPDLVLVHGDTTTTFAAGVACFYNKISIAHVEAGLRTGFLKAPWPEEFNRRFLSMIAEINFAPTKKAELNLLEEKIDSGKIIVTGNTVIDSLNYVIKKISDDKILRSKLKKKFSYLHSEKKLVLITGHRRENFGEGFDKICNAIKQLATSNQDVEFIYPVHLNPNVQKPVYSILSEEDNVHLIDPVDYISFTYLMSKCTFIITDSGGIQEEAPSLQKPVLVLREVTERPEALSIGAIKLVGTNEEKIIRYTTRLLKDESFYKSMQVEKNPYGDGSASKTIVTALRKLLF